MKHALHSPSSSSRWLKCPGSVYLIQQKKVPWEPSLLADKGILAHHIAHTARQFVSKKTREEYYRRQEEVPDQADQVIYARDFNTFLEEMIGCKEHVRISSDIQIFDETYFEHLYKIQVGGGIKKIDIGGTPDYAVYSNGQLNVIDFKSGKVPVSAERNTQLLLYAGAIIFGTLKPLMHNRFDLKKVNLVIHQPSISNTAQEWMTTPQNVADFLQEVYDLLRNDLYKIAPHAQACKYCDVRDVCEDRHEYVNDILRKKENSATAMKDNSTVSLASDVYLEGMYNDTKLIEQHLELVKREIKKRISIEKFKGNLGLKDAYGNTHWKDVKVAEEELKKILTDKQIYEKAKIRSPTQINLEVDSMKILDPKHVECAKISIKGLAERTITGKKIIQINKPETML